MLRPARQILDFLLPEMENKRGSLVVVLAGYRKPMEDLMAFNEGLPSRFPSAFTFPDYEDAELLSILRGVLAADTPRFTLRDDRHARILSRRLGRMRGQVGFGNARAVRNAYERAVARQSARVLRERAEGGAPDPLLLERDDLLGPKAVDAVACPALAQLRAMRGLGQVKGAVESLLELVRTNAELEEQERPVRDLNLNRVFVGNPGTGGWGRSCGREGR
jgi:hypothetical protein